MSIDGYHGMLEFLPGLTLLTLFAQGVCDDWNVDDVQQGTGRGAQAGAAGLTG